MKKVIEAFEELFALYEEPVDNNKLALLIRNLNHFSEDFILEVIRNVKYTRISPFPPKFPDFIAEARNLLLENYTKPEDAWGEIVKSVKRGHSGFDDLSPEAKEAVDNVCGWEALRMSDNLLYYRSAFIDAYKKILDREITCQLKP